jgi:uncharacterized protein YjlB
MAKDRTLLQLINPNPEIITTRLEDDGMFPNNPTLPLIIYRRALNFPGTDSAAVAERVLHANNWTGSWRNGIYPFQHYHSTAHEVLVVCSGSASVQLGGPNGREYEIAPGDVVVLPAGTAHKNLGSSSDFLVVGAYPDGQEMDMCYGKPGEHADENIRKVPLPKTDPVYGENGLLIKAWCEESRNG